MDLSAVSKRQNAQTVMRMRYTSNDQTCVLCTLHGVCELARSNGHMKNRCSVASTCQIRHALFPAVEYDTQFDLNIAIQFGGTMNEDDGLVLKKIKNCTQSE